MKKLYWQRSCRWAIMLLTGAIGCHQDPFIPQSAIPNLCRIDQITTINESTRDTTTFLYNTFGLIEKSIYRQWVSGQLTNKFEQNFSYTADHYLLTQVERTATRSSNGLLMQQNRVYTYTYQDGRLQRVSIVDNLSNARISFKDYEYEGDKLKTYTESDGSQKLIRRYKFDGAGKLIGYEDPNSGVSSLITNGKITQRILQDSTLVMYSYDSEGQLIQQISNKASQRIQYTYTYDANPYWAKTQLQFRGIPTPDLGEPMQLHNLKQWNLRLYQSNKLVGEQTLTYSHAYNKQGYSLGYGRSDGVRQINYYSNCL